MRVGIYEVVGRVAAGPSSSVWKGRDPGLGIDVALKQLHAAQADAMERLRSEAAVLARLDHPNIVRVFDLVTADDGLWLAEEWVEGASLATIMSTAGQLTVAQTLGVVRGGLLGLAHAHRQGVVHGDFAPQNILVETSGESKLIDFGLAGTLGQVSSGGTPGFASPESLASQPLSLTSDVYSAAAVVTRALRKASSVTAEGVPVGTVELGGLPAPVVPVLQRALSTDPALRHPDAQSFLDDFSDAAQRAFGAGWWTTAGVGTAAAAATPALLAVLGAGAGAGAVATEVAAGGGSPVMSTAVRSVRHVGRVGRAPAAIAAVAGVAVLAVVGAAVAVNRSDSSTTTAVPAAAPVSAAAEPVSVRTPSPTPSASPKPAQAGFVGRYRYRETVTASNTSYYKVGSKVTQTWTVTTRCAKKCESTVDDSSSERTLTSKAGGLGENFTYESDCIDTKTKKKQGYTVTSRYKRTLSVSKSDERGVVSMKGSAVDLQLDKCKNQQVPLQRVTWRITVERI